MSFSPVLPRGIFPYEVIQDMFKNGEIGAGCAGADHPGTLMASCIRLHRIDHGPGYPACRAYGLYEHGLVLWV